jgi:ATP-dependent Clp protease protease subunit
MSLAEFTMRARPGLRASFSPKALARFDPTLKPAAAARDANITMFGPIGIDLESDGVTARRVAGALREIGAQPVTVQINSPGGDVFEGHAIYELLRGHARAGHRVRVEVLGMAASAASIVAMSGDEIAVGVGSSIMIHNASVMAAGNRLDFLEVHDWLAPFDRAMVEVYAARTGQPADQIAAMMDKGDTWLTAEQALELGFADSRLEAAPARDFDERAAAKLRAERIYDLLAAYAGLSRKDARALRRELKGGAPAAPAATAPGAGQIAEGLQALLDTLKTES